MASPRIATPKITIAIKASMTVKPLTAPLLFESAFSINPIWFLPLRNRYPSDNGNLNAFCLTIAVLQGDRTGRARGSAGLKFGGGAERCSRNPLRQAKGTTFIFR